MKVCQFDNKKGCQYFFWSLACEGCKVSIWEGLPDPDADQSPDSAYRALNDVDLLKILHMYLVHMMLRIQSRMLLSRSYELYITESTFACTKSSKLSLALSLPFDRRHNWQMVDSGKEIATSTIFPAIVLLRPLTI